MRKTILSLICLWHTGYGKRLRSKGYTSYLSSKSGKGLKVVYIGAIENDTERVSINKIKICLKSIKSINGT